jgi:hypothetical protein
MSRLRDLFPPRLWGMGYHGVVAQKWLSGDMRLLDRIAGLRDHYRGKRAFVVGNGASLRQLDMARLRGEHLITMNSFFEHRERLGIRPVAHVFFDDWYFSGPGLDMLKRYEAQRTEELTVVPLTAKDAVAGILRDPTFFFPAGAFEHNTNLDLARPVPYFQTVALPALLLALHLGFDPVYLVGIDLDMLSHVVGVEPLRVRVPYFYNDEPVLETLKYDYVWFAKAIVRMHEGFRFVADHLPPGRHVYNAGSGGLLEPFPRAVFDSLF